MAVEGRRLDRIYVRDLAVRCIVGTNEDERVNKQDVIVNIKMDADLSRACENDRLEDTVDYRSIKKRVAAMVEQSQCLLVERLAQRIADLCLEDGKVQRVVVSVDKPGALRFARSVAVEIERERSPGL